MTLVAGIDVGNTTTEIVVSDVSARQGPSAGQPRPVAWDRAPTRSWKGSEASLHGAAVLLRRIERRLGAAADLLAVAPLCPVHTRAVTVPEVAVATGRLEVVPAGGSTPGAAGVGAGRPVPIGADPVAGPAVVLLVPAGTGYREAVARAAAWLAAGADVRAMLLADDEGVLVSARLPRVSGAQLPVVDQVDVDRLASCPVVAVEVPQPGQPLQQLTDPIRLSWLLGLDDAERPDAVEVARQLGSASRAVVARRSQRQPAGDAPAPAPAAEVDQADDTWEVALAEVAASVAARVEPAVARARVVASLGSGSAAGVSGAAVAADGSAVDGSKALAAELGRPVARVTSEAAAARAGAASTPGVRPTTTVVDLGGGTVDAVAADGREVVVAGAGELLTVAVARFLGLPRGAADWVKRGPSSRLEAPQVLLAEDGQRRFLDRPAPSAAVGSLVVPGPAGLLPFGGSYAPAEWRALRLRTKERVLADNVVRALAMLGTVPDDVLLVGGAAADSELVHLLGPLLPGAAVGRGDVAGTLGHRYAVAYGLTLLARDGE